MKQGDDEPIEDLLRDYQAIEQARPLAKPVAAYYYALMDEGLDSRTALELTKTYLRTLVTVGASQQGAR